VRRLPLQDAAHGAGARVEVEGDELRLVAGGSVQSVAVVPGVRPRGYWPAMLPRRRPAGALILGLGAGTIAHLLWQIAPDLPIVGVEQNQSVLDLGRERFGLDSPLLRAIHQDARAFVRDCRERFDLVIVDLFNGEELAPCVETGAFRRRVRSLVEPGGTLVWNLHRDRRSHTMRRRALQSVQLDRRILIGLNAVIHVRRRRRRPREDLRESHAPR
jgi:hypothetical protein